jgi:hypothetical protein
MILPRGRSRKRFNEFQELRVGRVRAGRRAVSDFFSVPGSRFIFAASRRQTASSAVSLNVVAQQSGFLVAIWSKLPLPFPVHLCSFFAGHL